MSLVLCQAVWLYQCKKYISKNERKTYLKFPTNILYNSVHMTLKNKNVWCYYSLSFYISNLKRPSSANKAFHVTKLTHKMRSFYKLFALRHILTTKHEHQMKMQHHLWNSHSFLHLLHTWEHQPFVWLPLVYPLSQGNEDQCQSWKHCQCHQTAQDCYHHIWLCWGLRQLPVPPLQRRMAANIVSEDKTGVQNVTNSLTARAPEDSKQGTNVH